MEKIKFLEDSLLVNNEVLVFSDSHIGYEEYLYGKYVYPRIQLKEIIQKLERIFKFLDKEKIKIKRIVILGDLKHEFGEISDSEWRETLKLLDYLLSKIKSKLKNKIILIKGNHDNVLGPIARKREIVMKEFYKVKDVCFLHGDSEIKSFKDVSTLIMGHLHSAISLKDKYKTEKYKCFLMGSWKKKKVYFIPSFIPLSYGYDFRNLDSDKNFSFINFKNLKEFKVIIYNSKENSIYDFGKLKKFI